MKYLHVITKHNLRKIRKHFFSSLLVVIGISIGTGGVFAAIATGGSVQNSINLEFTEQNVANMSIITDGVSPEIGDFMTSIPNVSEVELRLFYKTDLYYENNWKRFILVGISDFSNIRISKFAERIPSKLPDDAIILDSSARELGIEKGETMRFYSPQGPVFLTVADFSRNPEFLSYSYSGEAIGFCQLETAKKISGFESPNCILVTVMNLEKIDETYKALLTALDQKGISVISLERNTPQSYHIRNLVIQTQFLIIMVSFMVLFAACIFLWNSTTALLLEEKKEIQTMETVGLNRAQRVLMYFPSKVYVAVVGTVIGLPLGWVFHNYLTSYFCGILNIESQPIFSFPALIIEVFLGIVFSTFFSLVPIWIGARTVKRDEISFPTHFSGFLRKIQRFLTLNIAVSSLLTHKARSIITVLSLTFFVSLFIVIQSTGTSIRTTLDEEIYDIRSYDVYVYFDLPIESSPEISQFVNSIEEVDHFEYWYVREGLIGDDSVQICGIPQSTKIYSPHIIEGSYFEGAPREALISKYLSRNNGTHVGDIISLDVEAKRIDLEVIGIVADADHDGKTIFVPINTFYELTGSENKITHIMIDLAALGEKTPEDIGMVIKEGLLNMNIYGTIRTKSESKEQTENLTAMFLLLFYSFLGLVGVIVFINTSYTIALNIINRKEEFHLLSILGARRHVVFRVILITAILLALPAWVLSVIFGPLLSEVFVQYVSTNMLPIEYTFSRSSIIGGLVLVLSITLVGTVYSVGYTLLTFSFSAKR